MKIKILLFTLFATALFGASAYAETNLPQNLRIGLYYQDTEQDSVEIISEVDNGLDIGIYANGAYSSLIKDNTLNDIVVKKDNYTFDQTDKDPSAYHVQIGDSYKNYSDTETVINAVNKQGFKAYPAYEDGWKVWIGLYSSRIYANRDIIKLRSAFSNYRYNVVNPSSKRIRITTSDNETKLIAPSDLNSRLQIYPNPDSSGLNVIDVNNKGYRGAFEFIRQTNSDMTIINVVPFEQYLYSVTSSEMPSLWNIEALKAQAVAARTYALEHVGACADLGFDMNPTTEFQAYNGYSSEAASSRAAVDATRGRVIYYDGKPISAVFFSSDGGYTENSENVWTSVVPYLRAVQDKYQPADFNKKNWTNSVTPQEIKDYYASNGIDIGDIVDIQVTSYSKSNNALVMKVVGTKGIKEYDKDEIRGFLGGKILYSQTFTVSKKGDSTVSVISAKQGSLTLTLNNAKIITKNGVTTITVNSPVYVRTKSSVNNLNINTVPNSFIFNGKGWGHGIGMSQWGAKGMGDAGFKYDQILKYYYTGIEVR